MFCSLVACCTELSGLWVFVLVEEGVVFFEVVLFGMGFWGVFSWVFFQFGFGLGFFEGGLLACISSCVICSTWCV